MNNQVTSDCGSAVRGKGTLALLLVVGMTWAGIAGCDWFMRFHWFRWQVTFISHPQVSFRGPYPPMQNREIPVRYGGDLTWMVRVPSFTLRYARSKPAYLDVTDEWGYHNMPPTTNRVYDLVVTGSSFMDPGWTADLFSSRLSTLSGRPVYNHAVKGRGPVFGLLRFFENPRFHSSPPKVVFWGLLEREIIGADFKDAAVQIGKDVTPHTGGQSPRFLWKKFLPASLTRDLPATSASAQLSIRAWNNLRYWTFNEICPDVAVSDDMIADGYLLFYVPAIRTLRTDFNTRNIDLAIEEIVRLCEHASTRGITLVPVLIPDKEQVYHRLLPESLINHDTPWLESSLPYIEQQLLKAGIPAVNLLPAFEQSAAKGRLLYWHDDTHWNSNGLEVAVSEAWPIAEKLLIDTPPSP